MAKEVVQGGDRISEMLGLRHSRSSIASSARLLNIAGTNRQGAYACHMMVKR